MKNNITDTIKIWLFPTLFTALSYMILQDVKDMQRDLRSLLNQSGIDRNKIENLDKRVTNLETTIYMKQSLSKNISIVTIPIVSRYFIKPEEFDIKKYLRRI